jgi:hypothetical protein
MMRLGFLPSDFNPMVLMLGEEPEDFQALSWVLHGFARDQADVRLDDLAFCVSNGTQLKLTASAGPPGIHAAGDGFVWRIDAARAAGFAAQAEALAEPGRVAGSEILECSTEDEIPVKLSRGEYTEDFLLPPG